MIFKLKEDKDFFNLDFGKGPEIYVPKDLVAVRDLLFDSIRDVHERIYSELIKYISIESWEGQILIGLDFEQILKRTFRKLLDETYPADYVTHTIESSGAIKHFEVSVILLHYIDFLIERHDVMYAWPLLTKANYHSATSMQKVRVECEWFRAKERSLQGKKAQVKKSNFRDDIKVKAVELLSRAPAGLKTKIEAIEYIKEDLARYIVSVGHKQKTGIDMAGNDPLFEWLDKWFTQDEDMERALHNVLRNREQ